MTFRRVVLAAALLAPAALPAQSDGNLGQYSPLVLLVPAGARTLAMGNTGIASRDDDVLFFNPAQLVIARGFSASVERYSESSSGGMVSAVTRFNTGGIAVGARMVDYETNTYQFRTGRRTQLLSAPAGATSLEGSVGIAQVLNGVRIGGAIKYVEDAAPAIRVGKAAVDFGLSKDFKQFYTVGLAVQNIGGESTVPCSIAVIALPGSARYGCIPPPGLPPFPEQFTRTRLPLRTSLGAAMVRSLGELDVVGTLAVSTLRLGWLGVNGGAEVGYSWLEGYSVAFRGGARRPLPGEQPLTGGVGFNMDRLSIDYTIEALSGSRVGQRFGLRVR